MNVYATNAEFEFQKKNLEEDLETLKERLEPEKLIQLMNVYGEALEFFVENNLQEEFEELRAQSKNILQREYLQNLIGQISSDESARRHRRHKQMRV